MEGGEAESCKGRSTSFQAHGRVRVQQGQHSWFWCTQVHSYTRPHLWPPRGVGWDRVGGGRGVSIAGGACSENNGSQFQGQSLLHNLKGTEQKKRKNVGTVVQTSKKVKDTKAKSINARHSLSSAVFLMSCHGGFWFLFVCFLFC